jgi:hypothetical protein
MEVLCQLQSCNWHNEEGKHALIETQMKGLLLEQLSALQVASLELERLAPVHAGRGWDPELDAVALQSMRGAWKL